VRRFPRTTYWKFLPPTINSAHQLLGSLVAGVLAIIPSNKTGVVMRYEGGCYVVDMGGLRFVN
jgi:hypothetical protein